jgi:Zn-dependent M28 family amino/carboxypeptidase
MPCAAALLPLLVLASTAGQESSRTPDPAAALASIRAEDIRAHVTFLASDELAGRSAKSREARRAAAWIAQRFGAAGLEPLGDEGTFLRALADAALSPNVAGILRGSGPGYVLVTAHYDHLAPRKKGEDRIFNGADDNASGTAALVEIAEALEKLTRPRASIVLVAFTGEELGLRGSRDFVERPPFPLAEVRGVVNLDMISRGEPNLVFCEGEPQAPRLAAAARKANETVGLEIRWNEHPEWLAQSDQWSFLKKDVPALYFGVEDHEDYHRVSDTADKILAPLAEKVTRLAFLIALDVAGE